MTDVHVTLKLAKSSNNYDYTDLKDYDEIQPQQSDAIGAKYTFGVPPIAKAGDTITIRWSKNLNTYGFGNEKFNSNIMTADGKNILAEPAANKSMTDNQFIFTLTDYVKDHNNIKGELLVPLFVDPKEVKNDSLETPISASLGNTSDKHYIVVHYNEYAHSYPSSAGSIITEDASNKEVSSVIYDNPEGDVADGGHVDVENIDGSNIKLDRNSLRSFKVYRVSPSIELPQSYDFDPHDFDTDDNVEDVTRLANYSFSKNVDNEPVMSIKLPASEYDSSKYVIEFTTKYESSDSKILGLRSKYWDGNDGTLTSSEFAFTEYSPESDVSGDNKPEPQTSTTTETESASQTVHYTGAGDKTPGDHKISKDNVFSREVTKDSTGKVVKSGEWTPDSHDFAGVKTPLVEGYHADKAVATTDAATPAKPDVETTVAYTKNGKIVPVDPDGNPIPNAPTPTYETDPKDPTKVVPDEPTPTIPGYSTHTKTVTPKNPGEDTPVVYTKDKTPSTDGGTTHTPKPEENTSVKPKSSMIPTPKPEENTSVKPKSSMIPTPKPEENTSVKPKSSIIPTPEEDNDGTNSSVNKTAKNVKTATTTAAIKKQDNQAQLPQTGSHKSTLALAAGSVLVLFGGLLVVLGLRKRRD